MIFPGHELIRRLAEAAGAALGNRDGSKSWAESAVEALGRHEIGSLESLDRIIEMFAPETDASEPYGLTCSTGDVLVELKLLEPGDEPLVWEAGLAYRLLIGMAVSISYEWNEVQELGRDMIVGRVGVADIELLRRGDCRMIPEGRQVAVCAVSRPCFALRVRRLGVADRQRLYISPGLLIRGGASLSEGQHSGLVASLLKARAIRQAVALASFVLAHSQQAFCADIDLISEFPDKGLQHLLLSRARIKKTTGMDLTQRAVWETERQRAIINAMRDLTNGDLLFLLALLLNAPADTCIIGAVARYLTSRSPLDRLAVAVGDLIRLGRIPRVPAVAAETARLGVKAWLHAQYAASQPSEMPAPLTASAVDAILSELGADLIFAPLFCKHTSPFTKSVCSVA